MSQGVKTEGFKYLPILGSQALHIFLQIFLNTISFNNWNQVARNLSSCSTLALNLKKLVNWGCRHVYNMFRKKDLKMYDLSYSVDKQKFALISVDLPLDLTAAPLGCLQRRDHPRSIQKHRHAGTGYHDSSLWISKISTCLNLSNPAKLQFPSLKPTLCFQKPLEPKGHISATVVPYIPLYAFLAPGTRLRTPGSKRWQQVELLQWGTVVEAVMRFLLVKCRM